MTITITLAGAMTLLGWLAMVFILGYVCLGLTILASIGEPEWWFIVIVALAYVLAITIAAWSAYSLWF